MTHKNLQIRPLNIEHDYIALTALTQQLGYAMQALTFKERLELIHQDQKYSTWVAEYDQKIVGYVGLIEQYTWQFDSEILVIQAFVIDEKYRGQGLGKFLLKEIENIALNKNITSIRLNSGNRPERFAAHEFYKKQGYSIYSLGFKKVLQTF